MSSPLQRRPTVLPALVRVETSVPPAMDAEIAALVTASGGASKRSVLRELIAAGLRVHSDAAPDIYAPIPVTATTATNRKARL